MPQGCYLAPRASEGRGANMVKRYDQAASVGPETERAHSHKEITLRFGLHR